ncbi:MAG: D-alanyl-D-alanine carboxypeptidase [Phascolarctobacterium sp.]|nr:D-alanyl-D-alanine carboxypeptidase [Phascolarctobacterium sp.]
MKKLVLVLMTTFFMLISATTYADELGLASYAAILVRPEDSRVLYEKHSTTDMYPASTTKLYTALLVMENCKNLQDKTKVSWNAIVNVPDEHETPYIYCGEEFTIEEFLNIMLVPSGNLIANVMAEYISGSIPKFVDLMNERSKTLGLINSHWVNPMGWFDSNHYTCAHDMAIIAQEAMKHDLIRKIVAKKGYSIPASNVHPYNDRYVRTTNHMMREDSHLYYSPVQGIKTGTGTVAGCNFVGYAEKDGMRLISVALASTWKDARFYDTKKLMEYGFANYDGYGITTCRADIPTIPNNGEVREQNVPTVKPEDQRTYTVSQARVAAEAKEKADAEAKAKEDASKVNQEAKPQAQENVEAANPVVETQNNNEAEKPENKVVTEKKKKKSKAKK